MKTKHWTNATGGMSLKSVIDQLIKEGKEIITVVPLEYAKGAFIMLRIESAYIIYK
jgi:hypothetical protein